MARDDGDDADWGRTDAEVVDSVSAWSEEEDVPVRVADESSGEGIAGTFAPADTIEAGDVDPENAAFVVLGALITLYVFAKMFAII